MVESSSRVQTFPAVVSLSTWSKIFHSSTWSTHIKLHRRKSRSRASFCVTTPAKSMAVDQREKEEEKRERIAREAFDEVDEDGNGYVPIDELHGLTNSLGVPLAPEEIDAALEELDEDNDGVLDREAWIRWCTQRFSREQEGPTLEAVEGVFDTKHGTASTIGDTLNGDIPGGEVEALAERARRARRRASTDIHAAAWSGDLELVKDFLQHDPDSANAIDHSEFGMGYRPLHYAAYGGFLHVCRELRANGARLHAVGDNGVSALFLAAQAGRSDVVSFLLDLGADPTEREIESGLCAADVATIHQEDCPDILGQMRGKLDLDIPPPPPDTPPLIKRVGTTSLQVIFSPAVATTTTGRRLPITRYKIKVEQKTPPDSSTKPTEASAETVETNAECQPEDDDWFTRSSLAKIVLVPAVEVVEREQKVVSVRGLRPETEYRVQVAAVNAIGFGPYGPASQVVRTSFESKNVGKAVENSSGGTAASRHQLSPLLSSKRKAKGRHVLAWEQRRKAAAEAIRLERGGGGEGEEEDQ